jgi:hypothetical protein
MEQSTIRAFQKIFPEWRFKKSDHWPEEFAIQRFLKKMEIPSQEGSELRAQQCWERWLETDQGLPKIHLPSKEWYQARHILHKWCGDWRLGPVDFPSGSEFTPTRGQGSVEAKLAASDWTCTHDNFELFARTCYGHKALKRAVRRRFERVCRRKGVDLRTANRELFLSCSLESGTNLPYRIFSRKVEEIITFVHGSRFSTVPKNNEKDRPINIEPFANILVQKRVGHGLKGVLELHTGNDLDRIPDLHKVRVSDLSIATIDLSDASDSVSLDLVKFLLPRKLYQTLDQCRSGMVLGRDGWYHVTKKISSMGNGFTFELMTLILTAICRVLDENATVFGDDIIIDKNRAARLIELLTEVGFKVNTEKSFIEGPFRESCGANWHRDFGYIWSFDFKYPENIHDCIVLYNKVRCLGLVYPTSQFVELELALRRTIPPALRGVWTQKDSTELEKGQVLGSSSFLSGYFKMPGGLRSKKVTNVKAKNWLRANQYRSVTNTFYAYTWSPKLRTPCYRFIPRGYWAKYEMYLYAGRRQKDEISGEGRWTRKLMCVVDNCMVIEAKHIHETRQV